MILRKRSVIYISSCEQKMYFTRANWLSNFTTYRADQVPPEVLTKCAALFSENYGVWAPTAPPNLVGKRVRMNAERLKQQYLWNSEQCQLVTTSSPNGDIYGHVFFVKFPFLDGTHNSIHSYISCYNILQALHYG